MEDDVRRNSFTTIRDGLSEWLRTVKYLNVQRITYDQYERTANRYINLIIGDIPIQEVTAVNIKRLLNMMNEKGLAFATTEKVRLILNEYFRYLVLKGDIKKSPFEMLQPVKRSAYESSQGREVQARTDRVIVFTPEEIEMMRDTYYKHKDDKRSVYRQSAVYFLMLNTGLRRGEMCGLLNSDIDMRNRVLRVRRSVKYIKKRVNGKPVPGRELRIGAPKTAHSIRCVPLNYVALEMIKQLRKEFYFGADKPLLCTKDGGFTIPDALTMRFRQFQIEAGIAEPKPLHALRHTFATNLINGVAQPGGSIQRLTLKQVADILGHKTTSITEQFYVKRDFSKLKGLTDEFEL